MPIRGFGGGPAGGPRGPMDRGPRDRDPRDRDPRDRGPRDRGPGYFSGVRLFHGPMRFMFFGRPVIITTGKQVGFMFGFIAFLVMLVSTFAVFGNLSMYKQDKEYYQTEYNALIEIAPTYLDIISKAKAGETGYGTTRGSYNRNSYGDLDRNKTGYVYYDYQDAYSVVYEFMIGSGSTASRYYDETLSTYYRFSDIPQYLEIAYHITADGDVYSVEVDFAKNYDLEVAYYEEQINILQKTIKTTTVSAVILIIIIIVIVALIILAIVKTIKKSKKLQELEDAKREAEVREAEAKAKSAEEQLNRKYRYCEYCGAKFPEGSDKCPNCGSSHFIIKK